MVGPAEATVDRVETESDGRRPGERGGLPDRGEAGDRCLPGVDGLSRVLDEAQRVVDWLRLRVAAGGAGVGVDGDPGSGAGDGGRTSTDGTAYGIDAGDETAADAFTGRSILHTLRVLLARVLDDPGSAASHYARFAEQVLAAVQQQSDLEPAPGDRRFKDPLWRTSPFYRTLLQIYLAWQRTLGEWAAAQRFDEADAERVGFVVEQLVAAFSPSNLPLQPAALKRAEATEGASAVQGLRQWADDLVHRRGMPQQIRTDAFRVGVDLATTPGAVVARHPLFELIEYASSTAKVHRRPLLVVPPQINKYYVFDLKPENSLFRYLVDRGFQVFTLSWRNPDAALRDAGLDHYVQATLQAIEIVRSIAGSAAVGLVSACAGGLTALATMGHLAMGRRRVVAHHSMLVTAPLSGNGSLLERFATRGTMRAALEWSAQRGVMEGSELARVFAWLRPNDLVWSYWINNYLLGRQPPSLDVLYWDNDSTRLPAALHRDFVAMAERCVFERPHSLRVLGRTIDFGRMKVDGYYVGGREDYLMPWHGVYRAARHFGGDSTFVLSASGHVQSILRPPRLGRTEHFVRDALPPAADDWLAGASRCAGSWWPHWTAWLAAHGGGERRAPASPGSAAYPPLMPAPGRYVLVA